MDKKERQAQRAKQEDEILVKVLWWIVGCVVLEALVLLLNRYYVNYTASQIDLAYALHKSVIPVLAVVFPVCFVAALLLWLAARKKGKLVRLTAGLTLAFLALAVCAVVTYFFAGTGIRFLYIAVPAVAVLALIYYLYQRSSSARRCSAPWACWRCGWCPSMRATRCWPSGMRWCWPSWFWLRWSSSSACRRARAGWR